MPYGGGCIVSGGRVWWNFTNKPGMEEVTIKRHPPKGRGMMGVVLQRHCSAAFTQLSQPLGLGDRCRASRNKMDRTAL